MSYKDVNLPELKKQEKNIGFKIVDQSYSKIYLKGLRLALSKFINVGIKNAKIQDSSLTQVIFDDVYGRNAEFENVDFTGSTFRNCNFKKAKFNGCTFKYCKFYNTELPVSEIIRCLPTEPNLREELSKSLKVNFSQLGDKKNSDKFLDLEIKAQQVEMFEIFKSRTKYYKERYDQIDRIEYLLKYLFSRAGGLIYGHGFKIQRLVFSFLVFILFLSLFLIGVPFSSPMGDMVRLEYLNICNYSARLRAG